MSVRSSIPGLTLAVGLAVAAYALAMVPGRSLLSPMLVAILLGIAVRNLGAVPAAAAPGLTYASKTLLRAGIVLLGLRLALPDVVALGAGPLVVIVGTVAATFATALALVLDGVQYLTGFVLACAMAAVGTAVNLRELLVRGGRALLFGVVLSAVTAGVALALTLAFV